MSKHFRTAAVALLSAGGLAALGCAATPLAPEAPPQVSPIALTSGEQRVVDHVFVVTDASGTMYQAKSFPRAKALSQGFVDALPERDARAASATYNAGSIGFGGDDRVALALQSFDRRALRGTVDQVQVMGRVDGRGGETPLHRVLGEIGSQLQGQTGRAAVVVFSDGEPDDAAMALDVASSLASSYASGVCYHGVQVGSDPAGAQFLQTLSEISSPCGSFRTADAIGSGTALAAFTKGVMIGEAPVERGLPAVAANACTGVTLRGIEFEFDRAEIRSQSTPILDEAASQLQNCPDVNITIEGHTDQRGSDVYNQKLSERRAGSVREYLVGRGVAAGRLDSVGRGESNLLDGSNTEEGHQRNRRVELRPR